MDENVYFTPGHQTSSWMVDQLSCRIQTTDSKITEQVRSWPFAKLVGRCIVGPTRIFSIPRSQWRWALKHLGIPLPAKNPKRIAHGIHLGRQARIKGAVGHSRKKLKAITAENFEGTGEEVGAKRPFYIRIEASTLL